MLPFLRAQYLRARWSPACKFTSITHIVQIRKCRCRKAIWPAQGHTATWTRSQDWNSGPSDSGTCVLNLSAIVSQTPVVCVRPSPTGHVFLHILQHLPTLGGCCWLTMHFGKWNHVWKPNYSSFSVSHRKMYNPTKSEKATLLPMNRWQHSYGDDNNVYSSA